MDQAKFDALADFLLQTAKEGHDFVLAQAHPVAQEVLSWAACSAALHIAVAASVVTALIVGAQLVARKMRKDGDDELVILMWLLRIVAGVLVAAAISIDGAQLLKVKVAPRLVLIETLRDAVKGESR